MSSTAEKIEFLSNRKPSLESGKYTLEVEQTIKTTTSEKITDKKQKPFTKKITFAVTGERFGPLKPDDVYAVFPPPGSLGEHSNVLPHITLTRSTLPWERSAGDTQNSSSWLVLLLFRDKEKPTPETLTLEKLKDSAEYPNFNYEPGQLAQDEVTVIDVPKSLLEQILPTLKDLEYLAHVRQAKDPNKKPPLGEEMATILCNRLPQKGDTSTVHLVSVENRYKDSSFDYQNATRSDDLIRFVSLKSWSFSCEDSQQDFTHLLEKLNRNPSTVRLKDTNNEQANKYLRQGYILLPHSLRQGERTVSWYRGPLIPGNNLTDKLTKPLAMTADELMHYDQYNGLFDISYAAAWELGRLLTLQNKHLAVELFNWKHQRAHKDHINNQQKDSHLPFQSNGLDGKISVPEHIDAWFRDLELLKEIPFNYLVPDERMLPPESIRFFCLDSYWVDCLKDGAFSIDRVTNNNKDEDANSKKFLAQETKPVSGFLMRSDVVSGWPSLEVDGYRKVFNDTNFVHDADKLERLRMERLAPNVLLCLFDGEVKTVDIFQKAEAMYFGLDPKKKTLRNLEGKQLSKPIKSIPWKNSEQKVLNIQGLAEGIKKELKINTQENFTSAQFAVTMIEGVKKVRFAQGRREGNHV